MKKLKLETLGTDRVLNEQEAAELYKLQKREATPASQEDIVEFLMSHDGNPGPDFVKQVVSSRHAYEDYVKKISSAMKDEEYREMFFQITKKVITVPPDHLHVWADKIAEAVIKQSQSPG